MNTILVNKTTPNICCKVSPIRVIMYFLLANGGLD
jgi:hypothetical protein